MITQIFGITYGDKKTEFTEYKNKATEKLWRFEYNPMIDICDNLTADLNDEDYLGIFSWKFGIKTGVTKSGLQTSLLKRAGAQVYNLSPFLGNNIAGFGCFMDWSVAGHGELLRDLIIKCCTHIGITYVNNPAEIIYANQFIAQKYIYVDYMQRVIKPCLELLEGELWHLASKDAKYTAGINKTALKQSTGENYYNYVTFVLERMAMQYVNACNFKTVRLI